MFACRQNILLIHCSIDIYKLEFTVGFEADNDDMLSMSLPLKLRSVAYDWAHVYKTQIRNSTSSKPLELPASYLHIAPCVCNTRAGQQIYTSVLDDQSTLPDLISEQYSQEIYGGVSRRSICTCGVTQAGMTPQRLCDPSLQRKICELK